MSSENFDIPLSLREDDFYSRQYQSTRCPNAMSFQASLSSLNPSNQQPTYKFPSQETTQSYLQSRFSSPPYVETDGQSYVAYGGLSGTCDDASIALPGNIPSYSKPSLQHQTGCGFVDQQVIQPQQENFHGIAPGAHPEFCDGSLLVRREVPVSSISTLSDDNLTYDAVTVRMKPLQSSSATGQNGQPTVPSPAVQQQSNSVSARHESEPVRMHTMPEEDIAERKLVGDNPMVDQIISLMENLTYLENKKRQQTTEFHSKDEERCVLSGESSYFDAVIVYDKSDYELVCNFISEVRSIVRSDLKEEAKLELFDSEYFSSSKVMIVEDVVNRSSVIFLYLTMNCDGSRPEIELICSETIGLTRLGYNHLGGVETYRKWIFKPIHTLPLTRRTYKTPIGLLTQNGIDWYDSESPHTRNRIVSIMTEAIKQRKNREKHQLLYSGVIHRHIEPFTGITDVHSTKLQTSEPARNVAAHIEGTPQRISQSGPQNQVLTRLSPTRIEEPAQHNLTQATQMSELQLKYMPSLQPEAPLQQVILPANHLPNVNVHSSRLGAADFRENSPACSVVQSIPVQSATIHEIQSRNVGSANSLVASLSNSGRPSSTIQRNGSFVPLSNHSIPSMDYFPSRFQTVDTSSIQSTHNSELNTLSTNASSTQFATVPPQNAFGRPAFLQHAFNVQQNKQMTDSGHAGFSMVHPANKQELGFSQPTKQTTGYDGHPNTSMQHQIESPQYNDPPSVNYIQNQTYPAFVPHNMNNRHVQQNVNSNYHQTVTPPRPYQSIDPSSFRDNVPLNLFRQSQPAPLPERNATGAQDGPFSPNGSRIPVPGPVSQVTGKLITFPLSSGDLEIDHTVVDCIKPPTSFERQERGVKPDNLDGQGLIEEHHQYRSDNDFDEYISDSSDDSDGVPTSNTKSKSRDVNIVRCRYVQFGSNNQINEGTTYNQKKKKKTSKKKKKKRAKEKKSSAEARTTQNQSDTFPQRDHSLQRNANHRPVPMHENSSEALRNSASNTGIHQDNLDTRSVKPLVVREKYPAIEEVASAASIDARTGQKLYAAQENNLNTCSNANGAASKMNFVNPRPSSENVGETSVFFSANGHMSRNDPSNNVRYNVIEIDQRQARSSGSSGYMNSDVNVNAQASLGSGCMSRNSHHHSYGGSTSSGSNEFLRAQRHFPKFSSSSSFQLERGQNEDLD